MKKIFTLSVVLFLTGTSAIGQIPTNGLVAWYPFSGNANDMSGNGNNGTVSGAMLTTDRFGYVNSAYQFTNSSDKIIVPSSNSLNTATMNALSVSFWFNSVGSTVNGQRILDMEEPSHNYNYEAVYHDTQYPDERILFYNWAGTTNSWGFPAQTLTPVNIWHHSVMVIDQSSNLTKIYIDGVFSSQSNHILYIPTLPYIYIGNHCVQNWVFYGKIDDIRFYNRVLTQSEITALFNEPPPPIISVTSPNGGETWQAGTTHNITWTSSNVTNVKIEYTYDNGSSWVTVVNGYPASSGSYSWIVPNTPSTQCKVKISDAGNLSVYDISNNSFTITGGGSSSIMILSPNGGEIWQVGFNYYISWTSASVNYVNIEYSTNNGSSWITIANNIASFTSNAYSWTVPNTPSDQCSVRITDVSNPGTSDQSDNVFTILESGPSAINVISPNGNEIWQVGLPYYIIWNSTNVTNVRIDYSIDNGVSWVPVVYTTSASTGYYSWTVPNTPSTQCKVKISDTSNLSVYDISNNSFTITGGASSSIMILSPNGGEIWQVGFNYNISWTSTSVNYVNIEYSTNNGSSWIAIANNIASFTSNAYSWTVPNTPSDQCSVRITDVSNPGTYDQSDNVFTILESGPSAINVISPNGNEIWQVGLPYYIIWNSTNVTNVGIDYSIDNGVSWIPVVYTALASIGYYSWTVPNTPSENCLMKISDVSNPGIFDVSDSKFTISPVTGIEELRDQVRIFPNPTTGQIKLYSNSPIRYIGIYDFMGIEVLTLKCENNELTIDISNFGKGIYYLRMNMGDKYEIHKVVVL